MFSQFFILTSFPPTPSLTMTHIPTKTGENKEGQIKTWGYMRGNISVEHHYSSLIGCLICQVLLHPVVFIQLSHGARSPALGNVSRVTSYPYPSRKLSPRPRAIHRLAHRRVHKLCTLWITHILIQSRVCTYCMCFSWC